MRQGIQWVMSASAAMLLSCAVASAQTATSVAHFLDFDAAPGVTTRADGIGKIFTKTSLNGEFVVAFGFIRLKPRTTYTVVANDGTADITLGTFTTNRFGAGALKPTRLAITLPNNFPRAMLREGTVDVLVAARGGPGKIRTITAQ